MQVSVSKKINLAINNKRPNGTPLPGRYYLYLLYLLDFYLALVLMTG